MISKRYVLGIGFAALSLGTMYFIQLRIATAKQKSQIAAAQSELNAKWVLFDNAAKLKDAPEETFHPAFKKARPIIGPFWGFSPLDQDPVIQALNKGAARYNGCTSWLLLYRGYADPSERSHARNEAELEKCLQERAINTGLMSSSPPTNH